MGTIWDAGESGGDTIVLVTICERASLSRRDGENEVAVAGNKRQPVDKMT